MQPRHVVEEAKGAGRRQLGSKGIRIERQHEVLPTD